MRRPRSYVRRSRMHLALVVLALVVAVAVLAAATTWLGMTVAVFIALEPVRALAHLIGA